MDPKTIQKLFRAKFRNNIIALLIILLPATITISYVYGETQVLGIDVNNTLIPSLVIVILIAIYAAVTWRCPNCEASLGRSIYPRKCPRCGVTLR